MRLSSVSKEFQARFPARKPFVEYHTTIHLPLLKSVIQPKHTPLSSHVLLEQITAAGTYGFAVRKQLFFVAILFSTALTEKKYTYLSHSSQNRRERNARMEDDRKSTLHLPLVTAEAMQVPPTAGLALSDVGQQDLLGHVCIASDISYLHSSPQPEHRQHMVLQQWELGWQTKQADIPIIW